MQEALLADEDIIELTLCRRAEDSLCPPSSV